MFRGWIIKESLSSTNILFKTRIVNTVLEDNSEGGKKITWTVYTAEVDEGKMYDLSKELEKTIKSSWYTHFTDGKTLIVVFHGKSFRLKLNKTGEEKDTGITEFWVDDRNAWKKAFEYGTAKGKVDKRYMLKIS